MSQQHFIVHPSTKTKKNIHSNSECEQIKYVYAKRLLCGYFSHCSIIWTNCNIAWFESRGEKKVFFMIPINSNVKSSELDERCCWLLFIQQQEHFVFTSHKHYISFISVLEFCFIVFFAFYFLFFFHFCHSYSYNRMCIQYPLNYAISWFWVLWTICVFHLKWIVSHIPNLYGCVECVRIPLFWRQCSMTIHQRGKYTL